MDNGRRYFHLELEGEHVILDVPAIEPIYRPFTFSPCESFASPPYDSSPTRIAGQLPEGLKASFVYEKGSEAHKEESPRGWPFNMVYDNSGRKILSNSLKEPKLP